MAIEQNYESVPEEAESTDEPVDVRQYIDLPNVAVYLDDATLEKMGSKVFEEYEIDDESRAPWKEKMAAALELAMQITKTKSFPWPNAANIKYPLLTTAALQFAARAYPAIVDGRNVVKAKVFGQDQGSEPDPQTGQQQVPAGSKQARADRISRHMSYQLTEQMEEWEDGTDKLLHMLPILGLVFRKVYYDTRLKRNVSELVPPDRLIVNNLTKTLVTAPRITEEYTLYPNEIVERERAGLFLERELGQASATSLSHTRGGDVGPHADDDDLPHVFLEQHRYWDMDEDGYKEPYIVTIHKDTKQVMRVVARFDPEGVEHDNSGRILRIEPVNYYTKYPFIPSPDGSFYDLGFGLLLGPLNSVVNTTINQLLDAGTLQTMGGGFIGAELRLKSGPIQFKPGEYKRVQSIGGDIKSAIVPLQAAGPSPVLFQLLGLLIEAAKDVASVKDVLTGDQDASNASPTTTLALIEQGLKVFSSIYKRIHRSLKKELKMLYRLNRLRLSGEEYFNFHDTPEAISFQDYEDSSIDVQPVSDPSVVTDTQKLGRAEFLMSFMDHPLMDPQAIMTRVLEAASIEQPETLFAKDQGPSPEQQMQLAELELHEREVKVKELEAEAKVRQMLAQAELSLAKAEGEEPGRQLQALQQMLQATVEDFNAEIKMKELSNAADAARAKGVAQ